MIPVTAEIANHMNPDRYFDKTTCFLVHGRLLIKTDSFSKVLFCSPFVDIVKKKATMLMRITCLTGSPLVKKFVKRINHSKLRKYTDIFCVYKSLSNSNFTFIYPLNSIVHNLFQCRFLYNQCLFPLRWQMFPIN